MAKNSPNLPPLPDDDGRRADAARQRRENAAAALKVQRRAQLRRRLLVQSAVGLVVVLIAVGVTVLALRSGDDSPSASSATAPAQVTSDGSFVVGEAAASTAKSKVTLQVVEDFQCPVCRQFEESGGRELLAQYAASKDVRVEYRGVAFLDRQSSTKYSTRALNASACVMPSGSDVWLAFHRALFDNQPPEGGDGLPDSTLISLAEKAGATDVASCIQDRRYEDWTASTTQSFFDGGGTGTPTLYLDGKPLSNPAPAAVKAAVDAALAK